ncbi:NrtR DNA-binding winged helix domain-containing protein [Endozoicomonas montiporae]|uniref:ADP-ribose pyrophosphatase n=1 Tax=Endozoicomonas montiporae CL-33 TaxID=570277 RepID=A0A142BC64_9GAMM|nr:NUDIX domain-containing protein [Endozoicomonas montiporae]AMO56340.1 ADP-ribose pyrophosphatase [Endozoicomonas montiporae CL-33]
MSLNTALISVDVVAFRLLNGKLHLLAQRIQTKTNNEQWMLPAGKIDPINDQSLDDTAYRQLERLTSKKPGYMEQVATLGDSQRDSRGWSLSVVYYALIDCSNSERLHPDACWLPVSKDDVSKPLAYDHSRLVQQAFDRLKSKIQYSSLPVYLLPDTFTLSEIHSVFSAVLDKAPPMRSIRNRFLQGDLLIDTGLLRRGSNRPAALYKVNQHSEAWLFDRLYISTL